MTGGELLGLGAIAVGCIIWGMGWWWESVRPTTPRYRGRMVRMRVDHRRSGDGLDLRQIPRGESHVVLSIRSKVPLGVVGYEVLFVASDGDEKNVSRVSRNALRVTRARIADEAEQRVWPARIDDGHGGMRGDESLSLSPDAGMLLHVDIEANKEVWSSYLALSLRIDVEGATQPYYARVPARTARM